MADDRVIDILLKGQESLSRDVRDFSETCAHLKGTVEGLTDKLQNFMDHESQTRSAAVTSVLGAFETHRGDNTVRLTALELRATAMETRHASLSTSSGILQGAFGYLVKGVIVVSGLVMLGAAVKFLMAA